MPTCPLLLRYDRLSPVGRENDGLVSGSSSSAPAGPLARLVSIARLGCPAGGVGVASGRRGAGVSLLGAAVAGGCCRGRTGSRSVTASRCGAGPRRDTVSRSGSRRDTVASRWGPAGFRSARSRDWVRGAVGWAAGAGLACPFLDAAGLASPAGGLG